MDKKCIARLIDFDNEGIDVSTGFVSVSSIEKNNVDFIKYLDRSFSYDDMFIDNFEVSYEDTDDSYDKIEDFLKVMESPDPNKVLNGYSLIFFIGEVSLEDFINFGDDGDYYNPEYDSVRVITSYFWWTADDNAFTECLEYCKNLNPEKAAELWWERETPFEMVEDCIGREMTEEEGDKLIELAKEKFEDFKAELSAVLRRYTV